MMWIGYEEDPSFSRETLPYVCRNLSSVGA
jgi:hypothetical protein